MSTALCNCKWLETNGLLVHDILACYSHNMLCATSFYGENVKSGQMTNKHLFENIGNITQKKYFFNKLKYKFLNDTLF